MHQNISPYESGLVLKYKKKQIQLEKNILLNQQIKILMKFLPIGTPHLLSSILDGHTDHQSIRIRDSTYCMFHGLAAFHFLD